MRRGEIVSVNFDSAQGSEANKTRPAVIVSNDAANATAARLGRGVITVVPVTSNITRIYPFQLLLPAHLTDLPRDSKAQAEQIRSVSVDRVGKLLGQLPPALLAELDRALRIQLSLLADVTATLTATTATAAYRQLVHPAGKFLGLVAIKVTVLPATGQAALMRWLATGRGSQ
jgi:mRNA interferase MazF